MNSILKPCYKYHSLSGRIGKVVASHAEGCRVDSRQWLHETLKGYTAHEGGREQPVNWIYRF